MRESVSPRDARPAEWASPEPDLFRASCRRTSRSSGVSHLLCSSSSSSSSVPAQHTKERGRHGHSAPRRPKAPACPRLATPPTVTPRLASGQGHAPRAWSFRSAAGLRAPELEGAEAGLEGLPPGAGSTFPALPSAPNPRPTREEPPAGRNGDAGGGQTASGVVTAQRIQRTGVRTLGYAFNGHFKEYTMFSILMTFH